VIRSDGLPVPVGWLSPVIVAVLAAEAASGEQRGRPLRDRLVFQACSGM
jgi:hypothetical protein